MADTLDQRERWDDPEEASRAAEDAHQSRIWTMMPVVFKKHDTDTNTVHAQVTVKQKHVDAEGKATWKQFPLLKDVPVHYPGAGGVSVTMPVTDGDEGMIVFASRSFDKWWNSGGIQEQNEMRMHDISDGFAIPGFRSQPRKLKNVSSTTWQLRTDEENPTQVVDFDPINKKITMTSPNPVIINAPSLQCTGEIIAKSNSDKIHLSTHTHAQDADSHGDTEQETHKPTINS